MEIIVTGSAFNTGTSIKQHIEEKVNIMAKKFKPNTVNKIHTVLNKDGINFLCRIDVIDAVAGKASFYASAEAVDAYPCVDLAIKKIEEQLIKRKEKVLREKKHDGASLKEATKGANQVDLVEEVYDVIGDDDAEEEDM